MFWTRDGYIDTFLKFTELLDWFKLGLKIDFSRKILDTNSERGLNRRIHRTKRICFFNRQMQDFQATMFNIVEFNMLHMFGYLVGWR